jgi:hypothetical protein
VTIYFLGEGLEFVDVPVLKVNRHYLDAATGDKVLITDPFVEGLTHDAIVVQINRLKNRRRTELERMLEVLEQKDQMIEQKEQALVEKDRLIADLKRRLSGA